MDISVPVIIALSVTVVGVDDAPVVVIGEVVSDVVHVIEVLPPAISVVYDVVTIIGELVMGIVVIVIIVVYAGIDDSIVVTRTNEELDVTSPVEVVSILLLGSKYEKLKHFTVILTMDFQ